MSGRRAGAVAVILAVGVAGRARAAELAVLGGDGCSEADTIADQVADLLGRPLASVTGVDFEVRLTRTPTAMWQLRLDTIDGPDGDHERRSRELTAASCGEVADAAAVAIAMTVRSRAAAEAPRPPPSPPGAPPPPVVIRPATPPPSAPTTVAGGIAVVGDAGALPHPGVGVEVRASLRHRRAWLALAGTAFASQEAHVTGGGGDFRLLFASAGACLPVALRRTMLLGCAGFELGQLSGEGVGVAFSRQSSTRWEAVHAEAGLSVPVAPRVAVLARAGIAHPLSRPQFVIDGATPVHRAAEIAIRLVLGAELEF